jgi:molecular chaperone GrpE (heat shock protein)
VFAWLRQQVQTESQETAAPTPEYSLQSGEDLKRYDRWYRLTPEEQNQLVLELDKDRQSKSQEQVEAEQKARLRANLPRLAAGQLNPGDIADILYGPNWQEKVVQYQEQKEQEQIAQTVAIVCFGIGGTLTGGCFVIWILWSIARAFGAVKRRRAARRRTVDAEPIELTNISPEQDGENQNDDTDLENLITELEPESAIDTPPSGDGGQEEEEDEHFERFIVPRSHADISAERPSLATQPQIDESPVATLLSDAPDAETEWSPELEWSAPAVVTSPMETSPQRQRFTPRPKVTVLGEDQPLHAETSTAIAEDTAVVEAPLKNQADDLQKQIAEFKEVAQSVQQASREQQSAPLSNTLKELAQQVSAIREYAASQQNRVEKLQDGYDWTIIRTFCLRVIRCIDNLENRITRLNSDDEAAVQLDEVKDELLFALESSGIEQFRPEIHSDYRRQEKLAEAVKEKEITGDSDQIGKIAKVIRPGYRYIIDEESCKIVRTAQVKLYG